MATVELRSYHGVTPDAGTSIGGGSLAFTLGDTDTPVTVPVPATGTTYSWMKQLRVVATSTPVTQLTNVRLWGAGSADPGVTVLVTTSTTYRNPALQADRQIARGQDLLTYTVLSPLAVTGRLSNPATGAFGDWIQLQLAVTSAAASGVLSPLTLTVSVDET